MLVALTLLRLHVGESFGWPAGEMADTILRLRGLRVFEAICVGVALATGGVALQVLLRNPLAEPYILGLSSGAAVGVMLQMFISYSLGRHLGANHIGALVGAVVSLSIVYLIGQRQGVIDPLGLLLVGVILSSLNGAIMMLLNYLVGPAGMREDMARWMMGYLSEALPLSTVLWVGLITAVGVSFLWYRAPALDVATFPSDEAQSLGVNLKRLRLMLFLISGVLAAGAVVLAGPIAFVGLVCPHVARLFVGPVHRGVVPAAALCGAILIVGSDLLSTTIDMWFGRGRLPIGIFTALIGGISFLWLLRPHLGRRA